MKFLLGLLFCFGFLLFAGTTEAQTQKVSIFQTTYQTSCLDIGKPQVSIIDAKVIKGFAIDIQKLRLASKQAVYKTNFALFYRYKLVPDCPVQYIYKSRYRYTYSYSYQYPYKYNQPPNYSL